MAAVALVVIAHRGASGTRPENTLAAFRRAHEIGAHMLELDVQLTRDGEVVVMHDWTLARTTDGGGDVSGRTLAEIRRLDAGRWFHPDYAGEPVPTLAEVLATVPLPVNVELKARGPDGLERRALEVVRAAGALDRVVFSSFDAESLVRLRALSADVDIAVLWYRTRLAAGLDLLARVGATALHVRKDRVAPEGVREAVARGASVRAWTVNDVEESRRLEGLGVSAVFTDFPERFLQSDRP
jgi:glycerophosphoryl diester phosphodiesterase